MVLVVGLYVFIGNSGVISFGHIGFTCLGAYATAWLTIPPPMKKMTLPGLPDIILNAKLPFWLPPCSRRALRRRLRLSSSARS